MNPSDTNIQSGSFEILKDKRLGGPAVAAGLLTLTLLWLCVLQREDVSANKWTMAILGPYCFELAYDDTLAAIKSVTTGNEDLLSVKIRLDSATVFALMKTPWRGPAEISIDNFPERVFAGNLNFYEQTIATGMSKKNTRIQAVIEVMNPEKILKEGMKVRKAVLLDTASQAVFLPDSAIFEMNGEAVVFPQSDWPQPRAVKIAPGIGNSIMIADGIKSGDEVSLLPPSNLSNAKPLSFDIYRKFLIDSRQTTMQFFVEKLNQNMHQDISDSFAVASEKGNVSNIQGGVTLADCTAVIDQLLLDDSSRGVTSGRVRIGPGEGGKLAPVSPEMLKEMGQGEKISVSVPAKRDTSADTLLTRNLQIEQDSSKASKEPPEEN